MDHGIILGFQQQVRFDLCFTSQIHLFEDNRVFPDYCIFAKFHHAQGISQQGASVSELPAALWRPQKKHVPGFLEHVFC